MAGWRVQRSYWLALVAACLAACLGQGCARSQPVHSDDSASSSTGEAKLPFHPESASGSSTVAVPAPTNAKSAADLPFRGTNRRTLPSGTLLTVQLQDSLSTAKAHAGDAFAAVIAAPVTVDGETVLDRGTAVNGRIESARSGLNRRGGGTAGSGYFRLNLNNLTLGGREVALQTSSLFARGTAHRSNDVRVPKGRDLTFRLTAPVTIDESSTDSNAGPNSPAGSK